MNVLAGKGFDLTAKVPSPWHSGLLFAGAIALNSIPAYREGILDMKNIPDLEQSNTTNVRKIGFYMLLMGYGLIIYKHKKMPK